MDWQQLCALLIVAAAFIWLLRTQLLHRGKGSGCGSCGGCAAPGPPPGALIAADELPVLPAVKVHGTADERR